MTETTHGIVLHYNRYSDDSAIVDIFTLSRGSLPFLVHDRRSKRKGGVQTTLLRPLNIVELVYDYQPNRSLHKIRELHIAHCYTNLPYDPMKETVALFLSEFLHYALHSEVQNADLYHYILYSLQWFDATSEGVANFHVAFLICLTHYLGFRPNLDAHAQPAYFDLRDGTAADSAPQHGYYLTGEEAAALPKLLRMNIRNMHKFRLNRQQRGRMLDVLTLYYKLHVPEFRELRSLAVLREVLS